MNKIVISIFQSLQYKTIFLTICPEHPRCPLFPCSGRCVAIVFPSGMSATMSLSIAHSATSTKNSFPFPVVAFFVLLQNKLPPFRLSHQSPSREPAIKKVFQTLLPDFCIRTSLKSIHLVECISTCIPPGSLRIPTMERAVY